MERARENKSSGFILTSDPKNLRTVLASSAICLLHFIASIAYLDCVEYSKQTFITHHFTFTSGLAHSAHSLN